jgi:subtilase family serine protease
VFFAPGDIATVYDIKPLYNSSVTGTGQSITIVGQSAIQVTDLQAFQSAAGINSTQVPNQFVVPDSGTPTVEADGDEAESDIDLEWSNATAPGATINFVYTGNNPNYGAFDSITYAIDEQIGTIISSSYGTCEAYLDGTQTTLESSLEQGTSQGQTIMSAAGDDGSTDCFVGLGTGEPAASVQEALAVDYPASSQYVTGMGGTEISSANAAYDESNTAWWAAATTSDLVSSALQYIPEVVWDDDTPNCGQTDCLSAGGGGTSTLFPKPSWQTGVPGISSTITNREVPDLALYASPGFPGYLVCSSDTSFWESGQESSCSSGFRDSTTGDLTVAGGTSFAAPIFSGMLALINQKAGYTVGQGQGLINPELYKLAASSATYASAFHDITSGNNDCLAGSAFCASGSPGFSAGVGYDQASGLGSVDVTNLATAWPANSAATNLTATTTTITAANSSPNVNASDSFTITVAAATGTPTGNVTVTVDDNAPVTEALAANGTYVYTTTFTTAGAHTILASYAATTTYGGSEASVTVNVAAVTSGTGKIALSSSPATLTVAQGSSGTETITVTPSDGYTGTVYLTVNLPTSLDNLCGGFSNPNTTTGDGVVPISSATTPETNTMTLDTNASDCATAEAMHRTGMRQLRTLRAGSQAKNEVPKNGGGNPVPLTVAFAGLLLAGFMGRKSRKLRGLAGLILLASVGLVAAIASAPPSPTRRREPTPLR